MRAQSTRTATEPITSLRRRGEPGAASGTVGVRGPTGDPGGRAPDGRAAGGRDADEVPAGRLGCCGRLVAGRDVVERGAATGGAATGAAGPGRRASRPATATGCAPCGGL